MDSVHLNEDLKNASRKLANIIMQSPIYQQFQLTHAAVLGNKAASSIMDSIKIEQERLFEISCDRDFEEDDFIQLNSLHKKAEKNPIINSYFEAERNLSKLTQAINTELTSLIGFDFALSIIQDEDLDEEGTWEESLF